MGRDPISEQLDLDELNLRTEGPHKPGQDPLHRAVAGEEARRPCVNGDIVRPCPDRLFSCHVNSGPERAMLVACKVASAFHPPQLYCIFQKAKILRLGEATLEMVMSFVTHYRLPKAAMTSTILATKTR